VVKRVVLDANYFRVLKERETQCAPPLDAKSCSRPRMARPISKTTKFILALPRTLSAKEVLAKAKASGHKTSEGNIYRVRRLHGGKKVTAKTAVATRAAASGAKALSKSDFIRSVPATMPAKEVVARAKAAGVKLDIQYVYRLGTRSNATRRKVAVARPAPGVVAKAKPNGFHASTEDLLRAVAAELGLGNALEILQSQRAQVRAVLGG
jgi:hypothetical protein